MGAEMLIPWGLDGSSLLAFDAFLESLTGGFVGLLSGELG
jgi:hypothetical protein